MSTRVLHVAQPTEAGVARFVADLAAEQVQRGIEVAIAAPDEPPLTAWLEATEVQHVPWTASRNPGPTVARETRSLRAVIERFDPIIVHLHSAKAGLAGRLALRGRRPTIFQPHAWSFEAVTGPVRGAAIRWERFAARWAHALVCVSEAERSRGEQTGIRGRWEVIPNGLPLDRWPIPGPGDREEARVELGLPPGPLAVCVGRLSRQKGQDVLLGAWPRVTSSLPEATLVLVGDGPARAALESALPGRAGLVGARDDVARWLVAADVVVLPSRWEGMSLSMLEAMAASRSLVATDVAGAREALSGGAGALVPIEDHGALGDAILARLVDPDLATREGVEARARVEKDFDFRTTASRFAELYERIV